MIQIAPSILAADFTRLGDEIRAVEAAGADVIHIDVMDGHFVPNLSIGIPIVAAIRPLTRLPLDVHLMVTNPADLIESFAKVGADWLSVHTEVCDLTTLLPAIKRLGCKAGAAINPPTAIDLLLPALPLADYCVVMSVNPGFAGQKMLPACLAKMAALKKIVDERRLPTQMEADGGVDLHNIGMVINAGAAIIVAGNAIFKSRNYRETIALLQSTGHSA